MVLRRESLGRQAHPVRGPKGKGSNGAHHPCLPAGKAERSRRTEANPKNPDKSGLIIARTCAILHW
jgi:hypothetical protein